MREGGLTAFFVSEPFSFDIEFSVVSLVANEERYRRLLGSFAAKGFTEENSEFFAVDNLKQNSFDGYSAMRAISPRLRGRHVLFTHDDIELTSDGITELRDLLARLEASDPNWMIAGNAGGIFNAPGVRETHFLHLDDPHGSFRLANTEPLRVDALDENFLVMPRCRMPMPSLGFSGFHLFATDLCLQARLAGGSSYVLPFLLTHHGKGLVDGTFPDVQQKLENKYSRMGLRGRLQAPAILMHFGLQARVQHLFATFGKWLSDLPGQLKTVFSSKS